MRDVALHQFERRRVLRVEVGDLADLARRLLRTAAGVISCWFVYSHFSSCSAAFFARASRTATAASQAAACSVVRIVGLHSDSADSPS